ncbi:hypothetical protein QW180_16140 [Vibrio sinaloensis]|nr:hypothetical protein [Vibrio sinaloensis]
MRLNHWQPNQPSLAWSVRLVTLFAEGSATDVVSLDPDSGEMRILNAGSTRVVVSDAGNEQYSAGQASFCRNGEAD